MRDVGITFCSGLLDVGDERTVVRCGSESTRRLDTPEKLPRRRGNRSRQLLDVPRARTRIENSSQMSLLQEKQLGVPRYASSERLGYAGCTTPECRVER